MRRFLGATGAGKPEAEDILRGAGREDIVMNRCIKREHMSVYGGVTWGLVQMNG